MIIIADDIKLKVKVNASDVSSRPTVIWIKLSDERIERGVANRNMWPAFYLSPEKLTIYEMSCIYY